MYQMRHSLDVDNVIDESSYSDGKLEGSNRNYGGNKESDNG